ncbi:MAG: glycerophosphodiester phosphodiesterase family protein [Sphingomicrobium sp.]
MRSSRSKPDPLHPGSAGFAHRGLHGAGVPENSMAAFDAAIALGAGIECDLRLTADGVLLIFHDRDGARLCGSALVVSQSTAAEVARLRLADGQPIPTLAELLDRTQGRVPLLLELKEERNAARFSAAVAAQLAGYDGPVGVMSFAAGVGHWLKHHAPAVRRGLVLSGRESRLARWISMRRADPHFLAISIARLGVRTLPVYAWTVRTPADRVRAAPLADALIWEADGRP